MTGALDAAWDEVELVLASSTVDRTGLKTVMAIRIMAAVRDWCAPLKRYQVD